MIKNKVKKREVSMGHAAFGADMNFAATEAYNLLRTNLSFSLPDMEGGKIIGVTSSCPQEGKSTTSINLAYALAEAGNQVLLIDSDMRRPSICNVLALSMTPGLSNLLAGEASEGYIHKNVLHPGLSAIMSGDIPPNPSELISSVRMENTLESFRSEYDYVIVDLPPVHLVSDPLAMSKYVDGVIVVVRHEKTRRNDVIETVRQLKFVGAHILGFVYNGYKKNKDHYYTSNSKDHYYESKNDDSAAKDAQSASKDDGKTTQNG
jgi:receptor protein-tyrosine kinase